MDSVDRVDERARHVVGVQALDQLSPGVTFHLGGDQRVQLRGVGLAGGQRREPLVVQPLASMPKAAHNPGNCEFDVASKAMYCVGGAPHEIVVGHVRARV